MNTKALMIAFFIAAAAAAWWMHQNSTSIRVNTSDRWTSVREVIGDYSQKDTEGSNSLWVVIGNYYNVTGDDTARLWRTAMGWFKGANLRPDGWEFSTNLPLQAALIAHLDAYPGTTESNFQIGQLL